MQTTLLLEMNKSVLRFTKWTLALPVMALFFSAAAASENISVVTSINPIHSLTSAILNGIVEPKLIIKGYDSVHGYQLKPSDAKSISNADVLIWVSPELESSLQGFVSTLPQDVTIIELRDISGLTLLPFRDTDGFGSQNRESEHDDDEHGERDEHDDDHGESDSHGHAHGAIDSHIWLDTDNAKHIAVELATRFRLLYPEHQQRIDLNESELLHRLDELEHELEQLAHPISDKPFAVFHDAYQYLENKLHLYNIGAITVNPELSLGAKRLRELQHAIVESGATCIFTEPQFNPAITNSIVQDLDLRVGVLDPLGAEIEAGPQAYAEIMLNMMRSIHDCLTLHP